MKKNRSSAFKYRSLLFSVVLFLVSTAGILGYNYFISLQLAKDAGAITMAVRQGMLIQKMAKEVMDIDLLIRDGLEQAQAAAAKQPLDSFQSMFEDSTIGGTGVAQNTAVPKIELSDDLLITIDKLKESSNQFDSTLQAFRNGGTTIDDNGQDVVLDKVTNPDGVQSLENIAKLWDPYQRLVGSFIASLSDNAVNPNSISYAVDYVRIFNDNIYVESQDLVGVLEQENAQRTYLLRLAQIIGISAAIILFSFIVFYALRQLVKNDRKLEEARQETNQIMDTVPEGLFLLDKDLKIGSQYSKELEEVIGKKDLVRKDLIEVLQDMIPENELATVKGFILQLYNPKVKEKLIRDLNPLTNIEAQVNDFSGLRRSRYLNFKFNRVYSGENIARVLCSVNDTTRQVLLEKRLAEQQEQGDMQIGMLNTLLQTDINLLKEFVDSARGYTVQINNILKERGTSQTQLQEKLKGIFREVHGLKGVASSVNLYGFVTICREFEEKIKNLQAVGSLAGDDFLPLTAHLDELFRLLQVVEHLIERISGGGIASTQNTRPAAAQTAASSKTRQLAQFVKDLANRHDKQVSIRQEGFESGISNKEIERSLYEITVQLLRNAVIHGIETPQVRKLSGKSPEGTVTVQLSQHNNIAELTVEDNGGGLNFDKIKKKAVESGKFSAKEIQSWDNNKLISLLFSSGFSTADEVDDDAGRGVGLDLVRDKVKKMNGKIKVSSKPSQYTRFTLSIPLS